MQLQAAVNNVFLQLKNTLENLSDEQYCMPSKHLNNSTIGQHTRHVIEMFVCLNEGYDTGVVNYENRKRDPIIETNKEVAINLLNQIILSLDKIDKPLFLEGSYNEHSALLMRFDTNYHREVVYNLEHTIHHMALIRVGLRELNIQHLSESFGVAPSTAKHKKTCAQ
jgi:hypothetical protein